jgi:hypothetical protein
VRLEPDEGKLSSPVLRGLGRSNPARLPDRLWVLGGENHDDQNISTLLNINVHCNH